MARERAALTGHAHDIKEQWFRAASLVVRPVFTMIGDTFPIELREQTNSVGMTNANYDPKVALEYHKAYDRARKFLYEGRNQVNDHILPRYDIERAATPVDTDARRELISVLVNGCLDRLYENLVANSPILVAEESIKKVQQSLKNVMDGVDIGAQHTKGQREQLTESLVRYTVEFKPGVISMAKLYDRENIDYHIPPSTMIPQETKHVHS